MLTVVSCAFSPSTPSHISSLVILLQQLVAHHQNTRRRSPSSPCFIIYPWRSERACRLSLSLSQQPPALYSHLRARSQPQTSAVQHSAALLIKTPDFLHLCTGCSQIKDTFTLRDVCNGSTWCQGPPGNIWLVSECSLSQISPARLRVGD